MTTSTVIVLAVIVILIIWAIGVYNSLVSMRQRVNQAYADVDLQLRLVGFLLYGRVGGARHRAHHRQGLGRQGPQPRPVGPVDDDGHPIDDDDEAITFLAARMKPVIEDDIPVWRGLGAL